MEKDLIEFKEELLALIKRFDSIPRHEIAFAMGSLSNIILLQASPTQYLGIKTILMSIYDSIKLIESDNEGKDENK